MIIQGCSWCCRRRVRYTVFVAHVGAGPALADVGPNARPGRGAQCKT